MSPRFFTSNIEEAHAFDTEAAARRVGRLLSGATGCDFKVDLIDLEGELGLAPFYIVPVRFAEDQTEEMFIRMDDRHNVIPLELHRAGV